MLLKVGVVLVLILLVGYGAASIYDDYVYEGKITISEDVRKQCLPKDMRYNTLQEIELRQCLKESLENNGTR